MLVYVYGLLCVSLINPYSQRFISGISSELNFRHKLCCHNREKKMLSKSIFLKPLCDAQRDYILNNFSSLKTLLQISVPKIWYWVHLKKELWETVWTFLSPIAFSGTGPLKSSSNVKGRSTLRYTHLWLEMPFLEHHTSCCSYSYPTYSCPFQT